MGKPVEGETEMFIVNADDCFIAVDVKMGGGTIFTEAQPECECDGRIHTDARAIRIFTLILVNPEGEERIVTIPEESELGKQLTDMDIYYYLKSLKGQGADPL